MNIVGLTGAAGSGKSTAAEILERYGWVSVSLADPMKRFCAELFGWGEEQLWGPSALRNTEDRRYLRLPAGARGKTIQKWNNETERYEMIPSPPEDIYLSPRHALQQLGTEWGRACYEDVWVEHALRTAKTLLDENENGEWQYSSRAGLFRNDDDGYEYAGVVISDVRFENEARAIVSAGGRVIRISGRGGELGQEHESERLRIPLELLCGGIDNSGSLERLEHSLCAVLSLDLRGGQATAVEGK